MGIDWSISRRLHTSSTSEVYMRDSLLISVPHPLTREILKTASNINQLAELDGVQPVRYQFPISR